MHASFRKEKNSPFGGIFCGYKDGQGSEYYRTFLTFEAADDFIKSISTEYDTRVESYPEDLTEVGVRVYYIKKTAPKLVA